MSSHLPLTEIDRELQETAEAVASWVLDDPKATLNFGATPFYPRGVHPPSLRVELQPPSYEEACAQLAQERASSRFPQPPPQPPRQ